MDNDIFGVELSIDDYVLYAVPNYDGANVILAQIKQIENQNYTLITLNSSYSYTTAKAKSLVNTNDKVHMIEDSSNKLETLRANDLKINERILETQQEKDKVKNEKNTLRRNMKPGDMFKSGGYSSYFIYMGVKDKEHIFTEFSKNYRYGRSQTSDPDYLFTTNSGKFCQRMKGKKLPTSKFEEELNIPAMFSYLKRDIQSSRYSCVTIDVIEEVEELYNNIGQ